jgi:hypothetical protein
MHHENFQFDDGNYYMFWGGIFLSIMTVVAVFISFGFLLGQRMEREKILQAGELCDRSGTEIIECRKLGDTYLSVKE